MCIGGRRLGIGRRICDVCGVSRGVHVSMSKVIHGGIGPMLRRRISTVSIRANSSMSNLSLLASTLVMLRTSTPRKRMFSG